MNKKKVLIIGAGVSGLSCAYRLLQKGHEVVIIAKQFSSDIVSSVAGALWEWPPAVCGQYELPDNTGLEQEEKWAMESYNYFIELSENPHTTGVYLREVVFYFERRLEEIPNEFSKMNKLSKRVLNFKRNASLANENGIPLSANIHDAYSYSAPVIDTEKYLEWLHKEIVGMGGSILEQSVDGDLGIEIPLLLKNNHCDIAVNCTGMGAYGLGDKTVFPVRGGLLRVINDGTKFPKFEKAHCMPIQNINDKEFIFIVPRGENILVLGGFADPFQNSTEITLENNLLLKSLFERCMHFMPILKNAVLDPEKPFVVGLRPYRKEGVRLEIDKEVHSLIHNYGHGGEGFLLSWGCAVEIAELVKLIKE
jgi:D-amino-acid oxidase